MNIFLLIYLITTGISMIVLPIRTYTLNKKECGKRKAIIKAIEGGLWCFVPVLPIIAVGMVCYWKIKEKTNKWIDNDPTSPKNIANPDFTPPLKKEKKYKGIKSRFNILDL